MRKTRSTVPPASQQRQAHTSETPRDHGSAPENIRDGNDEIKYSRITGWKESPYGGAGVNPSDTYAPQPSGIQAEEGAGGSDEKSPLP
jgi:hypothetical protein